MTSLLLSLEEIGARLAAIARTLGAAANTIPTLGRSRDFAHPHIEVDTAYHYVVVERGEEYERLTTADLDILLYRAAAGMAFTAACDWAASRPRRGEDFRRRMFARRVELLGRLSPAWAERAREEIREILARAPYVD